MQPRGFGGEDYRRFLARYERVTLHVLKQVDHPAGFRPTAVATFRIEREGFDLLRDHRTPQLPLQQRLHQQYEEVHAEQRLDAVLLQIHRRHHEFRLHLLERRSIAGSCL